MWSLRDRMVVGFIFDTVICVRRAKKSQIVLLGEEKFSICRVR